MDLAPEKVAITVASARIPGTVDYRPEVRLVRAALLYGDHVTLFSLFGDLIEKGRAFGALGEDELIDLTLADSAKREPANHPRLAAHFARYRRLRAKQRKARDEMLFVAREKERLRRLARDMKSTSERILAETGANELLDLLGTGLVTVHTIDSGGPFETNPNGVLEYLNVVSQHLANERTYPLLDQTVSQLLSPAVESGDLVLLEGTPDRTKRISLAADFLFRLPLVNSITGRDILSIRGEFEAPLLRFRSAVIQMSRELRAMPWESSFGHEAQSIYDSRVVPAMLDIGEAVQSNRWISELLSSVVAKPLTVPTASAIGMLIANATAAPSLLVQVLAASAGAGVVLGDAVRRWRANQSAIERNQLFYYWSVAQR